MKRTILRLTLPLLIIISLVQTVSAEELIPVGQVVGLELDTGTVTVAAFADDSPAKACGVRLGDHILTVNGEAVSSPEAVRSALERGGDTARLRLRRGGAEKTLEVSLRDSRLGVYLKKGVTGIGTVTYYDPATGEFAALGHGITDSAAGEVLPGVGSVYRAKVTSVRRGEAGKPGQLLGALTQGTPFAPITANTPQGVFGTTQEAFPGTPIPTAPWETVCAGEASILCTVDGAAPREYSVQICRVYPATRKNGRNLLIRVTDEALLSATGGIVQGMSGSPILQNGHLIGAVTHVLVNDPTTGYGIFIENMLDAA